jgi:CheY-like chemotaxis protein
MLLTLLEKWGYEVVLAADGHEAKAILARIIREDQRNGKPVVLQTCCLDSV